MVQTGLGHISRQTKEGGQGRSCTNGFTNQRLGDLCLLSRPAKASIPDSSQGQGRFGRGSTTRPPTKPRMSGVMGLVTNWIGVAICVPSPYQVGLGMASGSCTSTTTNQPVTELESATPVAPERQGAWTSQDWEAHLAKLEKHKVWFQQAARQVSAPGNAMPFGSDQRGE